MVGTHYDALRNFAPFLGAPGRLASGVHRWHERHAERGRAGLDRYEIRLAGELHQLRRELRRLSEEARGGAQVLHEVTRVA